LLLISTEKVVHLFWHWIGCATFCAIFSKTLLATLSPSRTFPSLCQRELDWTLCVCVRVAFRDVRVEETFLLAF
jgi:hypothetical protein